MLHTKIPLNPYPYDCLLYIGDDEETFKVLESHGLSKEGTEFFMGKVGFTKSEGVEENRNIILWLREPSIVCLVHEAIHVVTFLFDRIGVPISFDNDETLAYTVQYLIREVMNKFGHKFNLGNKTDIKQMVKDTKQLLEIYGYRILYPEVNNVSQKIFSEKEEKNTVSCSVDPATEDRTVGVSIPTTPEDKEKIEAIRDFIKGNAEKYNRGVDPAVKPHWKEQIFTLLRVRDHIPFPQLIEEISKYYEGVNLVEHEDYVPARPFTVEVTDDFSHKAVDYDEYLKVVNLLNTRTSKFFTPSENTSGLSKKELELTVDRLRIANQETLYELKEANDTINNLRTFNKNANDEISKLILELAATKGRLESARQHNYKVNGLNDELTKELIDSRKIQDKDRGLNDELNQEIKELKEAREALRERIKVLEEGRIHPLNQTNAGGFAEAFAAIGEPKIDFSKYSEQVLAIFCNRWFETYRKFPTEDQFDHNGLQMIADYLALGTYKEEIKAMLNCYDDDNVLNQRIHQLSTITTVVKKWFDKLHGVDNREGGC